MYLVEIICICVSSDRVPDSGATPDDFRVLPRKIILVRHAESEGNVDNYACASPFAASATLPCPKAAGSLVAIGSDDNQSTVSRSLD